MGTIPAPHLRGYRSYENLHKAAVTGGLQTNSLFAVQCYRCATNSLTRDAGETGVVLVGRE